MTDLTSESSPHSADGSLPRAPMHLIEELHRYLEFDGEDARRLEQVGAIVHPHREEVVESFYTALEANPRTHAVFEGPEQLKRLRGSLARWLDGIFGGVYNERYYARTMHIGRVHVSVGLAPHFVTGAMNIIRRHVESILLEDEAVAQGIGSAHVASMHKILDLEHSLILQSYWDNLFEQKLRVPQALAMGLAHEIRNPLNSIGLNLTLLERRLRNVEGGPELAPMIEVMRQEVRRIGSLTGEIMDFAKPITLDMRRIDAENLLQSLRVMHEPTLAASRIDLILEREGAGLIWGDRDKLLQVLTNLVNNAAEAIEGEGEIRIAIRAASAHTTIEVADNGVGMDPASKHRIFELFFTSKVTGTGLGLAIVNKIVEAHGGSIDLETRPGRGAKFLIYLPREEHA